MATGVSLQTLDHFSGGGGTAPKFYIIMVVEGKGVGRSQLSDYKHLNWKTGRSYTLEGAF
jgi:hypothetical protein